MGDTLLDQLKAIVNSIDDASRCCAPCTPCGPCPGGPCGPCAPSGPCITSKPLCPPPCPFPYLQVCMLTPPPCPAPTEPKYVKPLTLPCPPNLNANACEHNPETDFETRYSNFYNNYNVDYHTQGISLGQPRRHTSNDGVCVDGKKPKCEDYRRKQEEDAERGCPTGFKPCTMKLCPPPGCCHPLDPWRASVLPCPPKPIKKVSVKYTPGPCTRPCCKHWKPKDGPCLYDQPCKAHCIDHPPGIKPSC